MHQTNHAENFEKGYARLNAAQQKAVDTIEGPVVVIAGPGTGKTQILTLRIANILRQAGAGIGPENILALTFTNAGVAAMRERLATFTGASTAYKVGIFTFHGFAEMLMHDYPEYFAPFFEKQVATDLERLKLVESLVKAGPYKLLKTFGSQTHNTKNITAAIDKLKQEGISPDEFTQRIDAQEKSIIADEDSYYKRNTAKAKKGDLKPEALKPIQKNHELRQVYAEYQEAMAEMQRYDFNDMLLSVIEALGAEPELQASLMERYQYILVDEHQDTNGAQNRILELLTDLPDGTPPNLFTVGDDKQAIYRFQGASIENFLHFAERFTNTVKIDLTHNYRSTQPILDAAHQLISHDAETHVPLIAGSDIAHEALAVYVFDSYQEELAHVAYEVSEKIAAGVDPNEIAIFYIENRFLAGIQEALEKRSVSYVVNSKDNILRDPVMQKLFWFLRAVANPMNNERLGEVLLMDMVDVDAVDALTLFEALRYGRTKQSLLRLLQKAGSSQLDLVAPEKLEAFAAFVVAQKKRGENIPFVEFFDDFVRESGFLKYILARPHHETHLRQLAALLQTIKTLVTASPVYRLQDFLQYVDTLLEYDVAITAQTASSASGVRLMTAHGSKGLEFEHVYITNVVSGRWDNKKSRETFKLPVATEARTIEDERRLLYVALTRGKKSVTLTYAKQSPSGKVQEPSQFLQELASPQLTEETKASDGTFHQSLAAPRTLFLPSVTSPEYLRERFLGTKLSFSALSNFLKSPLLYFFRNLVRLPSSQTKVLAYGDTVHKALEAFFREAAATKKLPSEEFLVRCYQEALSNAYLLHEYYEEFLEKGETSLRAYWQHWQNDFVFDIESEKQVLPVPFVLDSGEEILLTGIIDKIEYLPNGTVRVVDYKTGKSWSQKDKNEKASLRRQIVFYKMLLDGQEQSGKQLVMAEGMLDFIEPNKKGEFEREYITVTDADVAELKQEINAFAQAVMSGEFLKDTSAADDEYTELLRILQGETLDAEK